MPSYSGFLAGALRGSSLQAQRIVTERLRLVGPFAHENSCPPIGLCGFGTYRQGVSSVQPQNLHVPLGMRRLYQRSAEPSRIERAEM